MAGDDTVTVPFYLLLAEHLDATPGGAAAMARSLHVSEATMARWRSGAQIPEEVRALEIALELRKDPAEVTAAIQRQRLDHQQQRRDGKRAARDKEVEALKQQVVELQAQIQRMQASQPDTPSDGR
jgi:hypothetical protein